MNYTSYIIHRQPFRPELLISDKKGWREVSIAAVLPASIVGMAAFAVLVPAAWMIDGLRRVKLEYLLWQKRRRRERYINNVLVSLGHKDNKEAVWLLWAA